MRNSLPFLLAGAAGVVTTAATVPSITKRADTLADCLTNANVPIKLSSSSDWGAYIATYNTRLPYTPAVVVVPTTAAHIQSAVLCAGQFSVPVQAKSGGHSYASFSTGGKNGAMVITLETFQDISVDSGTGVATVGGGVRVGNLALGIGNKGRALAHGTCPGIGIGGHFTHGGYGFSSRAWGLAMDAIIGLDVVLANGTTAHCTADENTDLFFALRGAAESFGIVTTFYLQTQPAPTTVVNFNYGLGDIVGGGNATSVFTHLQAVALNSSVTDRNLGYELFVSATSGTIIGTYFGALSTYQSSVETELLRGIPVASNSVKEYSWLDSLAALGGSGSLSEPTTGYNAHDNFYAKSAVVPQSAPLSEADMDSFFSFAASSGRATDVSWWTLVALYGGPDSQIAAHTGDAYGAYSHRNTLWVAQLYASAPAGSAFPSDGETFMDNLHAAFVNARTDIEGYGNYVDPELSREEAHSLYYGDQLSTRLTELKGTYDPQNVFSNPQSFESGGQGSGSSTSSSSSGTTSEAASSKNGSSSGTSGGGGKNAGAVVNPRSVAGYGTDANKVKYRRVASFYG